MSKKVLYICGGRNFLSTKPGRKIEGVVSCWKSNGYLVKHVCGGDLISRTINENNEDYGSKAYHAKWYRKTKIFNYLVRSVSEYKDINNDKLIFQLLEQYVNDGNKPDVIWERSSRLHKAGLDLARKIGVPYVLEWKDHLIPYKHSFFRRKAQKIELMKNNDANYIVVESEILKQNLIHEGISANKVIVAYNAIEPSDFDVTYDANKSIRREYNIPNDVVLIGYLGSYAFYHDTSRLILAVNILRKTTINKFKVVMVGNGLQYDQTRKLAIDLGLLDNFVIFKDGVSKDIVPNILSELDIAVLPGSTDIICPIKVQEYMYMGLPSVVPKYNCNIEVIDHGNDGILFEPNNEKSLAEQLKYLIENNERRKSIGANARKKALDKFTWDKTWGKALDYVASKSK